MPTFSSNPSRRRGPIYYKSGLYVSLHPTNSVGTSNGLGNQTLRLFPVDVGATVSFDRLALDVSLAGDSNSTVIIACYADDGSYYPGALLLDSAASGSASTVLSNGKVAGDSATVQAVTVALTLTPGIYWFGAVIQGAASVAPTLRASSTSTWSVGLASTLPAAAAVTTGYSQASVSGALPSTFTTTKTMIATAPRVIARVA
jgi:hypothetical protein